MMLRSFAEAAVVSDSEEYRRAAVANATCVLERLRVNGRLLRTYKEGTAKLKAYTPDYSMLVDGPRATGGSRSRREGVDGVERDDAAELRGGGGGL